MQKNVILAESGGTKTDWKVWENGILIKTFTTGSFHPDFLMNEQIDDVVSLIPQLMSPDYLFRIYSAGCFREEGKLKLRNKLSLLKAELQIKSDVEAAVEATGIKEGWVCILGTGSVLIHFNGVDMQLFGGLGWEHGDEGSGFYFGKLVVEALEKGVKFSGISEKEASFLIRLKGDRLSKKHYSSLSKQIDILECELIHEMNLQLFIKRYLVGKNIKNISIVGGYASAIEVILRRVFYCNQLEIKEVVTRPIDRL